MSLLDRNFSPGFTAAHFGDSFIWGVSSSAAQTEGAYLEDGKGLSNWDVFSIRKNKIADGSNPFNACNFYFSYDEDLELMAALGIKNFRLSIAWSRIFPMGTGQPNMPGINFYSRVVDKCLELGITPWITLYHWDLPHALELKGGWTNREILSWFKDYVSFVVKNLGHKVKNWMVLNEPMVFTGAGYFLGVHAPGKKGIANFLSSIHHAALCQAIGFNAIKEQFPEANVGTTISCSYITPQSKSSKDIFAAARIDALLNRLFVEPFLGMGYPREDLPFLSRLKKFEKPGDAELLKADFDFLGIQNYTREVVGHTYYTPFLNAKLVPAKKRGVYHTTMGWEVYPNSIHQMIKKFSAYQGIKRIIVTENGAAFNDKFSDGQVLDAPRIDYLSSHIKEVLKAKNEGGKVYGYFVWSFTDNFEWNEGFRQRFGLVYYDYSTGIKVPKESAWWFKKFLATTRARIPVERHFYRQIKGDLLGEGMV
jgi:beta-glucosidase